MTPLRYTCIPSPLGLLGVAVTERGVCRLDLAVDPDHFRTKLERLYGYRSVRDGAKCADVKKILDGYFSGTVTEFTVDIDVTEGTDFQRRVWRMLRTIPFGQVRSYAWVAEQIGHPKAVRAVGQANGRNPVSIIIPCHRVIRHDGTIGGYGSGIETKMELLRREGIPLSTWEKKRVTVQPRLRI